MQPMPGGRAGAPRNPMLQMALVLMFILMLIVYSRLNEMLWVPRLFMPPAIILLLYCVVATRWTESLSSRATLLMLVFLAWMLICAVLGQWPGGSMQLLQDTWFRALLLYALVMMVIESESSLMRVMGFLGWCTAFIVFMALWRPATVEGSRLAVGRSSFGNPNDLAAYLLVGLPFCAWYAMERSRWRFLRLVMAIATIVCLVAILRTGSRMGLVALAVQLVATFWLSSRQSRIRLMAIGIVVLVPALLFLPASLKERYLTIVTEAPPVVEESEDSAPSADLAGIRRAVGSTEARWDLFVISLKITLRHPLLGVGPGEFPDACRDYSVKFLGQRVDQQSHNTLTQVSSENGIPGLILYIALLVFCLKRANMLRNAGRQDPALAGYAPLGICLYIAIIGFTACALFSSLAYGFQLPLLCGMVAAAENLLKKRLRTGIQPMPLSGPQFPQHRPWGQRRVPTAASRHS